MISPPTVIPFAKFSACGNDFLIVDGSYSSSDVSELTRRMCDRHNGIGADGVEWLFPSTEADISARLVNSDGSFAEISGNGTRCVAAYLCGEQTYGELANGEQTNNDPPREEFRVATGAGVKVCRLTARREHEYEFETEMGEPEIEEELAIQIADHTVRGIPLSMGNPHYVIFVSEFALQWQVEAAQVQLHQEFPQGVNVELVRVTDSKNIVVRFFERGAGETQSSGTGSCASAVAAIATGRIQSPVRVHAPGGVQTVRWAAGSVFLRGSAQMVCCGEYFV
jgi:diaminopimelate epimerase